MNRIGLLLPFFLLVCAVSFAWGQEVTGSLEGRVLDSEGNPLAGVGVTVEGTALQGTRQAVTDARGYFRVVALPVGSYDVTLRHVAYHEASLQEVGVRLGKTTNLAEIRLQAQVLEMPPVVVIGERPLIDPTTATTGGNLPRALFENIPTERNYRSIITLFPQANASFFNDETNVNGATGFENMYYIDGVNVTDPYNGSTGTNLPYDFVQEIELKRGGYEAEFGHALGGIVNVVTGTGSNEFAGSVFGYYTSDSLSGDPKVGLVDIAVDDFSDYDAGFSVSGPIVKDRLWYFLAYDRAWRKQDVEIPGFGLWSDDTEMDMYAGKLTWKASQDTELILTAMGDPAERSIIGPYGMISGFPSALANPDPVLAFEETGGHNASLSAKTFVGSRLLIDASAAFYDREEDVGGATERGRTEPRFIDQTTGEWSGGWGSVSNVNSERWSVQASATAFLGRHTLKGGIQYEEVETKVDWATPELGNITYDGSIYSTVNAAVNGKSRAELPSVYLQDSWQMTDRLRVNFGLRWDGASWYGREGWKFVEINDQYQPRIGFTYQPSKLGTQQIFGSAGRFYQRYPLATPALFFITGFDQWIRGYIVDPRVDPDGYLGEFQFGEPDPHPSDPSWNVDLEGEHSDAFTLGYERRIGQRYKASVIGAYHTLRNALRTGIEMPTRGFFFGNPGEGPLSFLPNADRDYWSVELGVTRSGGPRLDFQASWVISRNEGNVPGLYPSDQGTGTAGNSISLRLEEQGPNSNGKLPNDRTHVFKLSGAYRFDHGVTLGMYGSWMDGTPLNEFGASSPGAGHNIFLVQRGSAGRTPSIWDLNLRCQYTPGSFGKRGVTPRFLVDFLHVGSEEEVVWNDQVRYLGQENGNQINPNPNYGEALRYQPPMSVRVGMEVSF
jgi:hypothetical protein